MKLRFCFVGMLLIAGTWLSGCRKQAPAAPPPPPPKVTVQQPVTREEIDWDEYPARLDSVEMVEVRSRVQGYLQEIHFKDGAEVKKGDLLFVIDPRPFQAALERAQAELAQATTKFELASNELARSEKLLKAKAISEEEADVRNKAKREAEAAIQSARAMVETARLDVEYTRVTAPIGGRIGQRLMTSGNLVNHGQGSSSLLATIVSMDPIYAFFDAPEEAVLKYQKLARASKGSSVNVGLRGVAELELANEKGFPHHGELDFLDNRVDPTTGTLRVRGVFANPERGLQPGFFGRIRVPGSEKYSALLIPGQAIGTDQAQKFVYVINARDEVEYRKVLPGPEQGGLRVIREGLKPQDWVLVDGLMAVRPGVKVVPEKAGRAPAKPNHAAPVKGEN